MERKIILKVKIYSLLELSADEISILISATEAAQSLLHYKNCPQSLRYVKDVEPMDLHYLRGKLSAIKSYIENGTLRNFFAQGIVKENYFQRILNSKKNNKMKTFDEKAAEYSAILANQSGCYTQGEIETAYVVGAVDNSSLELGVLGTFGQALIALQRGQIVQRCTWDNNNYVVKQIDADIPGTVVPSMQSLPDSAKSKIGNNGNGGINYRSQCLLVSLGGFFTSTATNYIPTWEDMFATDWMIVE